MKRITQKIQSEADIIGTLEYEELIKEFFKTININCNFINNRCVDERNYNKVLNDNGIYCCCKGCKTNGGFYRFPNHPDVDFTIDKLGKEFPIIKKSFSNETGFWRKDIGCILPRKYRSPTCNFFLCWTILRNLCEH